MIFSSAMLQANFDQLKQSLNEEIFSGHPKDYQRIDQKTIPVIEKLNIFSGMHVLEVGSNFGMYSLLMAPFARKVTALELDVRIHEVSLHWKKFFEAKGCYFGNVDFLNQGVSYLTSVDYDALLLTLVLYHLTDDEIDRLIEDSRKKCVKAVIQCRPARNLAREKGAFTGHVSKNDRFDGLFDIAGNIRFLKEIGMNNISVTCSSELLGNEVFPVIVGSR